MEARVKGRERAAASARAELVMDWKRGRGVRNARRRKSYLKSKRAHSITVKRALDSSLKAIRSITLM